MRWDLGQTADTCSLHACSCVQNPIYPSCAHPSPPPSPSSSPIPLPTPEPQNEHAICYHAGVAQLAKQCMDLAQVWDTTEHHSRLAQGWGYDVPEGPGQAVFLDS